MANPYIVNNAVMMCIPWGKRQAWYETHHNETVKIGSWQVATAEDIWGLRDIPCFGVCNATGTGKACYPSIKKIINKCTNVKIKGKAALTIHTRFECVSGGEIIFVRSGQAPLSQADTASMKAQALASDDEMIDAGVGKTAQGQSMGKAEGWTGYIPFYGNARNFYNACQKGDNIEQAKYGLFLWKELVTIPWSVSKLQADNAISEAPTLLRKSAQFTKAVIEGMLPTPYDILKSIAMSELWDYIFEGETPETIAMSSAGTVFKKK